MNYRAGLAAVVLAAATVVVRDCLQAGRIC
jgi:hypothetical protein